MINIIPNNDEREHIRAMDCWCKPILEWGDEAGIYRNGPMVIHNSSDCLESVEGLIGEGVSEQQMWSVFES